jgi:methyl-accepting chemotaxis protein
MNYLETLSVRFRLILLAGLGGLLSIVIGSTGIFTLVSVNARLTDMYVNNLVPVSDLGNANMQAIYNNRELLAYVIESKKPEMDKLAVKMDANEAKMRGLLDKYRKTQLTPKETELLARFDKAWPPYMASAK